MPSTATFGLLFDSMAGVYEGFENEVGKDTELWYAYYTLATT